MPSVIRRGIKYRRKVILPFGFRSSEVLAAAMPHQRDQRLKNFLPDVWRQGMR